MSPETDQPRSNSNVTKRQRRYLRYSLRSALVLVAMLCGLLAWAARDVHLAYCRSRLVADVERLGGHVMFDRNEPAWHSARHWIGRFGDARLARRIDGIWIGKPHVTDADVASLVPPVRSLPEVHVLMLEGASITDQSLEPLALCPGLQYLNLGRTSITDEGTVSLSRLTNLKGLYVYDTSLTRVARRELQGTPHGRHCHLHPALLDIQDKMSVACVRAA